MDTQRTVKTAGLSTLLGLVLVLVLGVAATAASIDEIARSAWGGTSALVFSVFAVVLLGWRFNSQWQRTCAAPTDAQHLDRAAGAGPL